MNVLLLGSEHPRIERVLEDVGDAYRRTEEPLSPSDDLLEWAEWLVSFGYRHIVKPEVLALFPGRVINLHISLLPWNRGADPNVWSFLEDTPAGVTIHLMDEGLDTGDILAQRQVSHDSDDTLRTSYERLITEIEDLFAERWPDIRQGRITPISQQGEGTLHRSADLEAYSYLMTEGWDTPIRYLQGKALGSGQ